MKANLRGLQESSGASSLGLTSVETDFVFVHQESITVRTPGLESEPFQREQSRPFQGQDGTEMHRHPPLLDSQKGGIFPQLFTPPCVPTLCHVTCGSSLGGRNASLCLDFRLDPETNFGQ